MKWNGISLLVSVSSVILATSPLAISKQASYVDKEDKYSSDDKESSKSSDKKSSDKHNEESYKDDSVYKDAKDKDKKEKKKKNKSVDEIVRSLDADLPACLNFIKKEYNKDLLNPLVLAFTSIGDLNFYFEKFQTFKNNQKRTVASESKSSSESDVSSSNPDSVKSSDDSPKSEVPKKSESYSSIESVKNVYQESMPDELLYSKASLLASSDMGVSCAKGTDLKFSIADKIYSYKLAQSMKNSSSNENVKCSSISKELSGVFRLECRGGFPKISGSCSIGCGKSFEISGITFPDIQNVSLGQVAPFANGSKRSIACESGDSTKAGIIDLECKDTGWSKVGGDCVNRCLASEKPACVAKGINGYRECKSNGLFSGCKITESVCKKKWSGWKKKTVCSTQQNEY